MITVQLKTNRNPWDHSLVFDIDKDDISNLVYNYAGELGSDTISTATATTSNITAGATSISGNTVTVQVSAGNAGTMAKLEMKIVTAAGKRMSNPVRFRVTDYYEGL